MQELEYKYAQFGSIDSLVRTIGASRPDLNVTRADLLMIARQVDAYYSANEPEEKPSGGFRQTYSVCQPLKDIQGWILRYVLQAVSLPPYLFAVKNDEYSRDYIADALRHVGCRTLICLDIKDYFPSVSAQLIEQLWQRFFNFPSDVADLLTRLTVYEGALPQGAKTSSYLAILLLAKEELALVSEIHNYGLEYSRYIDDIYVSATRRLTKAEKNKVISLIARMLDHYDLRFNRGKLDIQTPSSQMRVHNLNLNSGKPTKSKQVRGRTRAAVKECEIAAQISRASTEYYKQWHRVHGRVSEMAKLHEAEAHKLFVRLDKIRPVR